MTVPSQSKYQRLLSQTQESIDHYEFESDRHKNMYRRIRYCMMSMTAFSTILAAISTVVENHVIFSIVVVILGAAMSWCTAFEGLRKPADLWLNERSIFHMLNDLKRELIHFGPNGLTDEELNGRFDQLQAILRSSSQKWKTIRNNTNAAPTSSSTESDKSQHQVIE